MTTTKDLVCPKCGEHPAENWDEDAQNAPANGGEWLFCISCRSTLIITNDATLREPTEVDYAVLEYLIRTKLENRGG